ncbi:MAG: hypothetical protein P1P69_03500 [Methanosarcinaceae archaeon]|nr:hypothetical protein [Methanosarcinaceae archaeon]
MSSIPTRIPRRTKDRIEKMQSRLRLRDLKLSQQQLIDDAIEYAITHEDDFIAHLSQSQPKKPIEDDTLWQLMHKPVDMGKTDATRIDEYLYGGE